MRVLALVPLLLTVNAVFSSREGQLDLDVAMDVSGAAEPCPDQWPQGFPDDLKGCTCVDALKIGEQSTFIYVVKQGEGKLCLVEKSDDFMLVKGFKTISDATLEVAALQALSKDDTKAKKFIREHIPKFYGGSAQHKWLAMGLVSGQAVLDVFDIGDKVRRKKVLENQYCEVFTNLWMLGWTHGDVNGKNELWDDNKKQLNLIDFGFARGFAKGKDNSDFVKAMVKDVYFIGHTLSQGIEMDQVETKLNKVGKDEKFSDVPLVKLVAAACDLLCTQDLCSGKGKCVCSR